MTSVLVGVLGNVYGSLTALELSAKDNHTENMKSIKLILVSGTVVLVLVAYFLGIVANVVAEDEEALSINLLGSLCSCLSIAYYISPLLKVRVIIRTRDVSSLYMPMLIMNLVATFLWTSYGLFASNDFYLYMCSGFSFCVTAVLVTLKLVFLNSQPSHKETIDEESGMSAEMTNIGTQLGTSVENPMLFVDSSTHGAKGMSKVASYELVSGIRRRGSSLSEFAAKAVGMESPQRGFVPLADTEEDDYNCYIDTQNRSRRSSSIVELASNALLSTIDVLSIAPPDNRSSVGSMGGEVGDLTSSPKRKRFSNQNLQNLSDNRLTPINPPTNGVELEPLHETDYM